MEINGYTLTTELQNKNSGFSTWGFCRRYGQEYFIKEFINPVYPGNDPYLSEELKQRKMKACLAFEQKTTALLSAVNRASNGNLVRTEEFFRYGSKYYLVTKKMDFSPKGVGEISALPDVRKEFLIRLVLHTMMCMHGEGVVHGDIKAANLLVHFDAYSIMAKVIDFDGGFLADSPPEEGDEITGDVAYLAPEVLKCMCGEFAPLSCKIDVFSLGVLLHQYWTGETPWYDHDQYDCIAEAILCGDEVRVDETIPEKIRGIIRDMIKPDPWDRISMEDAYQRMVGPAETEEEEISLEKETEVESEPELGHRSSVVIVSSVTKAEKKEPAAEETAVVEETATAEETATVEETAVVEETATVEEPAVVEETATVEEPAVAEETATVESGPSRIETASKIPIVINMGFYNPGDL